MALCDQRGIQPSHVLAQFHATVEDGDGQITDQSEHLDTQGHFGRPRRTSDHHTFKEVRLGYGGGQSPAQYQKQHLRRAGQRLAASSRKGAPCPAHAFWRRILPIGVDDHDLVLLQCRTEIIMSLFEGGDVAELGGTA